MKRNTLKTSFHLLQGRRQLGTGINHPYSHVFRCLFGSGLIDGLARILIGRGAWHAEPALRLSGSVARRRTGFDSPRPGDRKSGSFPRD